MASTYRITLWSGGKPALVHYVKDAPQMSDGCVGFKTDDGNVVRLLGNVSIEQGEFNERPITGMRKM